MSKKYKVVWRDRKNTTVVTKSDDDLWEAIRLANEAVRELDCNTQPLNLHRKIYRIDQRPPKETFDVKKTANG